VLHYIRRYELELLNLNRRENFLGLRSFLLEDFVALRHERGRAGINKRFHHKCLPPCPPHWVVTFLQQAANNFRANKKVLTQLFCFTFNVFLFLWLEITFLLLWKYETAVRPASGIMTLSMVPHGRGETAFLQDSLFWFKSAERD
jgi:hypothetical protein